MKNILLVDFNASEDWEFYRALNQSDENNWELYRGISNQNHGNKVQEFIRYIKYFTIPFKVFLIRQQYSQVLAWQQFYGLILAFYCGIFQVKNAPAITVMTFIYKPKKMPVIGYVYDKFIRFIVRSGYITRYIVYSENEREYYSRILGINRDCIVALKLGIEDVKENYDCEPMSKHYFLSAGRSNRDYEFLLSAWNSLGGVSHQSYLRYIA